MSVDEALAHEYLRAALDLDQYYVVPRHAEHIDEEGRSVSASCQFLFQVLSISGSHSRPHLMHTFQSPDEPANWASLAAEVFPFTED